MADKDFDIENALIEIEDMITDEEGGFDPLPSLYELARSRKSDMCSQSLFQYVSNLLVQGTNLRLIAFNHRGINPPPGFLDDLKKRMFLNDKMYEKYCGKSLT